MSAQNDTSTYYEALRRIATFERRYGDAWFFTEEAIIAQKALGPDYEGRCDCGKPMAELGRCCLEPNQ